MKAKHLIRELMKCPPDANVVIEGGTLLFGESHHVQIAGKDNIFIMRDPACCRSKYVNADDTPMPLPDLSLSETKKTTWYDVRVRDCPIGVRVGYMHTGTQATRDDPGEAAECEIIDINGLPYECFDADFLIEVENAIWEVVGNPNDEI